MSEINENNKCVYVHKDKEGVIRYVGSGTIKRAYSTYANSYRGKKYAEFVDTCGKPEIEIIAEGLSKIDSEDLERELFDKHKNTILNFNRPSSAKEMSKEMFEEHLYYDESSKSCLRWKTDRVGNRGSIKIKANSEAGCLDKVSGYYVVGLQDKLYKAHRIIALLHDLDVEGKVIDHIDRNRTNNKIENLRVVSQQENMQNMSINSNNTSGVQGVHYDKHHEQWVANWYEEGKRKNKCFSIAKYASSDEAFSAAIEYRKEMVELYYNN